MVATPSHIPGENRDALLARVARLEKSLATLGNRTRLSTVTGTLTAFDANTGANTVTVGQDTMTDLPLLVSGAEIGLEADDTVVIAVLGEGVPAIMGKLAEVGSASYGTGNNGRAGIVVNATNFPVTTAGSIVVTDSTIVVPGWANTALVNMNGAACIINGAAVADDLASQITVVSGAGNTFSALISESASPANSFLSTHAAANYFMPVIPDETLTVEYFIESGLAHAANTRNLATIFADLQFFRESS